MATLTLGGAGGEGGAGGAGGAGKEGGAGAAPGVDWTGNAAHGQAGAVATYLSPLPRVAT